MPIFCSSSPGTEVSLLLRSLGCWNKLCISHKSSVLAAGALSLSPSATAQLGLLCLRRQGCDKAAMTLHQPAKWDGWQVFSDWQRINCSLSHFLPAVISPVKQWMSSWNMPSYIFYKSLKNMKVEHIDCCMVGLRWGSHCNVNSPWVAPHSS